MTTSNSSSEKFVRLSRAAIPLVKLTAEHEPDNRTVSTGEWVRLSQPAQPVVKLKAEMQQPMVSVNLRLPYGVDTEGKQLFETLISLIAKVNEVESLFARAGVWLDTERSRAHDGYVVLVLVPNDQTDAVDTCKRIADQVFAAVRTIAGVTVKVVFAENPEKLVYELAA